MGYVESHKIKVFPCGGRNRNYDPLARLTTEYNLVSMINRLVDRDSFIVTTHANNEIDTNSLDYYQINIGGYLFTINAIKDIFDAAGGLQTDKKYLNAKIRIDSYVDSHYQQLGPLAGLDSGSIESIYNGQLEPNEDPAFKSVIINDSVTIYNKIGTSVYVMLNSSDNKWYYCDSSGELSPQYPYENGILDNISDKTSHFVGILFECSNDKVQNESSLTLFEHIFVVDDENGTYYLNNDGSYTTTQPDNYSGDKYALAWIECEDSKIKFETKNDGSRRSIKIDDGEL